MALISRSKVLCSFQFQNFFQKIPKFSQLHYIHKRVEVHPKIAFQLQYRFQSNSGETKEKIKDSATIKTSSGNKLSQKARLKQAVRDYGATIIVFHVTISLASLGICYLAIYNGVDGLSILRHWNLPDYVISSKVAVGGSTFVIAYAVHKLFAPVRIAATLFFAPFIVRYLRKINLLKPPPK